MTTTLLLNAESLCSKWGFGDGDALDVWWWDTYDEEASLDTDDLLLALVSEYLVPEMRKAGWAPAVVRIGTNHNPVRAEYLNGVAVDWYAFNSTHFDPPIEVRVTREQVEQMANAIRLREIPRPGGKREQ